MWNQVYTALLQIDAKNSALCNFLEQHKNAVAKEKVNIVAVDSTHGKNSNVSRAVGKYENPGTGGK